MPQRLAIEELLRRARAELALARAAHDETVRLGRTAARTNRLRSALRRAQGWLRKAVRYGLPAEAARRIYESEAPPDPDYGPARW